MQETSVFETLNF